MCKQFKCLGDRPIYDHVILFFLILFFLLLYTIYFIVSYGILTFLTSSFCFVQHYRQDCETFRTVVKMLVTKEPSLDNLLQAPLDANLSEIKQRCLDDLRHFVKELDEVLEATGHKTLK